MACAPTSSRLSDAADLPAADVAVPDAAVIDAGENGDVGSTPVVDAGLVLDAGQTLSSCYLRCRSFDGAVYYFCYGERTAAECADAFNEVCPTDVYPERLQSEVVPACDRCGVDCDPSWWQCERNRCNVFDLRD